MGEFLMVRWFLQRPGAQFCALLIVLTIGLGAVVVDGLFKPVRAHGSWDGTVAGYMPGKSACVVPLGQDSGTCAIPYVFDGQQLRQGERVRVTEISVDGDDEGTAWFIRPLSGR